MALQQTATAAIRLVRVTNLTERDAETLVQDFQLHPHDREALFASPTQPVIRTYRDYCFASLPWPVYDVTQNDLRAVAVRIIVAKGRVAVITDEPLPPLDDFYQALLTAVPTAGQTAAQTAATLLLQLAKWTASSRSLFMQQLTPSLDDSDRLAWLQSLQTVAAAVLTLAETLTTLELATTESSLTFRLSGHLLSNAATQLAEQRRSPVRHVAAPAILMPRLVGGYVIASAVVALLVLIAVR